jgi:outer membrane protein OmpA-like peptidoglycan-associated protein
MSPDGQQFFSLWTEIVSSRQRLIIGKKISSETGTCPGWLASVEQQMTTDLETGGRTRIYGINFDSDSDRIRDESKPTLEKIAGVLRAKPNWKITIEGHTDSTSTPQHNQELSERRAASAKAYLVSAGIEAARLNTAGFGATQPLATNDDPLGRAQNRRVELIKQ